MGGGDGGIPAGDERLSTIDLPRRLSGEWVAAGGYWFGTKLPEDGIAFGLEGIVNDAHDYVYNLLHSKSTRNRAGINDPELDAMIDKEVTTLDENERVQAIKAIVARANEKAYYAPIMVGPAYFALQPRVKGYTLSVTYGWGSETLSNVFLTS
jgi:ABC-type transport system substrate-binding protein